MMDLTQHGDKYVVPAAQADSRTAPGSLPRRLRRPWYRSRRKRAGLAVLSALAMALPAAALTPSPAVADSSGAGRSAPAAAARGSSTFSNPVFQPDLPDPSIIQDRRTGVWYAFGTTDSWTKSASSLHIMPIVESRNLVNWTFVRNTFSPPGTTPAPGSPTQPAWTGNPYLWAPEVHFIDGRYVMYYTASGTAAGGSAIGVATASSPAGPWHDSGGPIIGPIANSSGGYNSVIDPDEIATPGGQRYLYYGSFTGGLYVVPLESEGLKVRPGAIPVQVGAAGLFEGTNVVRHDGYYYLFASSGGCCSGPSSGYEEVVSRSRSPLGPFTDKLGVPLTKGGASVILAANGDDFVGPGGVTAFQDGPGNWWMVLHVIQQQDPYLGSGATRRPLALEPIEWGAGGWPAIHDGRGVTDGPQPSPSATAHRRPAHAGTDPLDRVPTPGKALPAYSEKFDTSTLGPQWSWLNEDPANWSLRSDPGTLTIDGQPGQFYQTDHSGQNVLLEKAPSGNFIAETKVALNPVHNFQQAGLVLWQNDDTWLKLVAESNAGNDTTEWAKQTNVTSPDAGFNCGSAYPANTCPVYSSGFLEVPGFSPAARAAGGNGTWAYLRIVREGNRVTAYTSLNGRAWTAGATYNLTGFSPAQPLRIGLMATGAGPDPILAHFASVQVSRPSCATQPAAGS
jgi:arabinan endo-1,5-alpha-L-arabinosidase